MTQYRAGSSVEDHCRVCKEPRDHRVIAADAAGHILRVVCGFCGSQHNFRGRPEAQPRIDPRAKVAEQSLAKREGGGRAPNEPRGERHAPGAGHTTGMGGSAVLEDAGALVSERERTFDPIEISDSFEWEGDPMDLEMLIRRIIREEAGLTPTTPAEKWKGGDLVLKPGKPGLQDKTIPIDTFFAKIVMLRNRLRVLEQQINAADVPDELKLKLQGYITGCYGTLTSFNVLFADEGDKFKGSGGD